MKWYGLVERSKGWIAQVRKLNVVAYIEKIWQAEEIMGQQRKAADPQNRPEWRGHLRIGQWTIKRI